MTSTDTAWDPISEDLRERLRPDQYGFRTKEQQKIIDKIKASRHLLLRNDSGAKCGRCGAVHPYITLGCVERPFNGLDQLYSFERQQAENRGLVAGENIVLTETVIRAMRIGAPVPISRKEAQRLKVRIRAKLGRGAI